MRSVYLRTILQDNHSALTNCLDLTSGTCRYLSCSGSKMMRFEELTNEKVNYENDDLFEESLKKIVKKVSVSGPLIVLLPAEMVYVKILEFDSLSDDYEEASKIVSWKTESRLPDCANDLAVAWNVIERGEKIKVIVLGFPRSRLIRLSSILTDKSVHLVRCGIADTAIMNGNLKGESLELFVQASREISKIYIFQNGKPVFIRNVYTDESIPVNDSLVLEIDKTSIFARSRYKGHLRRILISGNEENSTEETVKLLSHHNCEAIRIGLPDIFDISSEDSYEAHKIAPAAWAIWDHYVSTTS